MEKSPKIILGIDPGTLVMGYSVISVEQNQLSMIEMNVLKLRSRDDNYTRLKDIYKRIDEIIRQFQPHCFAIEAPFFGKNVQSMLKLGRAQGVAIAAAMAAGLEVCEYSPRKIKQSITGNGNADKQQVWKMLQQILQVSASPLHYYDASDALAVAVCHSFQDKALPTTVSKTPKGGKKKNDWKTFIAMNPGRLR